MKTHTAKSFGIFLLVAIVALAVGNYLFFHIIQSTGMEIAAQESEVKSLQSQVVEFSKYQRNELIELANSVTSKLIPHGDFVNFIETIEAQARSQGIVIEVQSVSVVPRSDAADDDKEVLHLKLETDGSFAETMRFVYYLEHMPYKVDITQMRISRSQLQEKKNTSSWQGQFEITVLKFK